LSTKLQTLLNSSDQGPFHDDLLYEITICYIMDMGSDEGVGMTKRTALLSEIEKLGENLAKARAQQGLSQAAVAARSQLDQARISYFEQGKRVPTLDQLLRLAQALDRPLQWFLTGTDRPGTALKDIIIELRRLGMVDLLVADSRVPGASRPPEEAVSLSLAGASPEPRVVEAIPAVLAWNQWNPALLKAYARSAGRRTLYRLAWLADITLLLDRVHGFPGGCPGNESLTRFLRRVKRPTTKGWDDLGHPLFEPPTLLIWKRWRINYAMNLDEFRSRAEQLAAMR
jgi:transcriptional regulator with XRE-family HTH domain